MAGGRSQRKANSDNASAKQLASSPHNGRVGKQEQLQRRRQKQSPERRSQRRSQRGQQRPEEKGPKQQHPPRQEQQKQPYRRRRSRRQTRQEQESRGLEKSDQDRESGPSQHQTPDPRPRNNPYSQPVVVGVFNNSTEKWERHLAAMTSGNTSFIRSSAAAALAPWSEQNQDTLVYLMWKEAEHPSSRMYSDLRHTTHVEACYTRFSIIPDGSNGNDDISIYIGQNDPSSTPVDKPVVGVPSHRSFPAQSRQGPSATVREPTSSGTRMTAYKTPQQEDGWISPHPGSARMAYPWPPYLPARPMLQDFSHPHMQQTVQLPPFVVIPITQVALPMAAPAHLPVVAQV